MVDEKENVKTVVHSNKYSELMNVILIKSLKYQKYIRKYNYLIKNEAVFCFSLCSFVSCAFLNYFLMFLVSPFKQVKKPLYLYIFIYIETYIYNIYMCLVQRMPTCLIIFLICQKFLYILFVKCN